MASILDYFAECLMFENSCSSSYGEFYLRRGVFAHAHSEGDALVNQLQGHRRTPWRSGFVAVRSRRSDNDERDRKTFWLVGWSNAPLCIWGAEETLLKKNEGAS